MLLTLTLTAIEFLRANGLKGSPTTRLSLIIQRSEYIGDKVYG
jgi:hypothetical protein